MSGYAVIFISIKAEKLDGYDEMAESMVNIAQKQAGFIDFRSYANESGENVSISYWQSLEDIKNWKENLEHKMAQKLGREKWYKYFKLQVCKIEREYEFKSDTNI